MFRGLHPPSLNHRRLNLKRLPPSQLQLNLWKKLLQLNLWKKLLQRRLRLQRNQHKLSLSRKLHLPKSLWRHLPLLHQSSHQTRT